MSRTSGLVLALVLLLAPSVVFADLAVARESRGVDATIRREGSSDSEEIGRLPFGETREVVGSTSHWYEIRLETGETGFVSRRAARLIRTPPPRQTGELRIHYLNVGAGSCALVECPGSGARPMLVDCGSVGTSGADLDGVKAATYLRAVLSKHRKAPDVVISHPHTDHYGLIAEVLADTEVRNIWLGGDSEKYVRKDFPDWLQERLDAGATLHADHEKDFDNDQAPMPPSILGCGRAQVFTLTVNTGDGANPNSHIMEIRYKDFGATFTGDAEGITEEQADLNYDGNVKTTVLTASHHGASSHGSNSPEWVQATQPEVVVFSSGPFFFHPRCNVVARYEPHLATASAHLTHCGRNDIFVPKHNTTVANYVTATNGLVVITSNGRTPLRVFCDTPSGCDSAIAH